MTLTSTAKVEAAMSEHAGVSQEAHKRGKGKKKRGKIRKTKKRPEMEL